MVLTSQVYTQLITSYSIGTSPSLYKDIYPQYSQVLGSLVKMNNSCTFSPGQLEVLVITTSGVGLLSFVASAFAIVTAVGFYKAHKMFSQRLVLYVLTSVLAHSGVLVVQAAVKYTNILGLCKTLAFLLQYALGLKFLFIFWITFYLYLLAEFNCILNKGKHEAVYVISSVVIPLLLAFVPLFTNTYGLVGGAWCWIMSTDNNCKPLTAGVIEQFVLWYGPLVVLAVLDVLAITRIAYILCKRAWKYDREHRDPSLPNINHKAALKEVLPVIAYPILFHATSLFSLADRLTNSSFGLTLAQIIVIPSWGWIAAVTLLIYLHVLRKHKRENVDAPSFTQFEPLHGD